MRRGGALARARWNAKPHGKGTPRVITPAATPLEPWRAFPEPCATLGSPVHIDNHVLCINKPTGILSQPDITGEACASQLASDWLGSRATCVHRIDKWATGCLMLARTQRAATRLGTAFMEHTVIKHYLVIVRALRGTAPPRAGAIGRIARHLSTDKAGKVQVDFPASKHTRQRHAELGWTALASDPPGNAGGRHALLAISLRGGYKHQIRALLGAEGLPLLGDVLYGGAPFASHPHLIALHAATLRCQHPIHGHAPLLLQAPMPAVWAEHAPAGMVSAAEVALRAPLGHGPLWEAHAPMADGDGRARRRRGRSRSNNAGAAEDVT